MQRRLTIRIVCVLVAFGLLGASGMLGGCAKKSTGTDTATRSQELTPGQFPEKRPGAPTPPPPPQLKRPQTAIYSYLLWISYAYRVLNSDVASPTFSAFEEVRVNSYVELNKQEGRAIDQRLIDVKLRGEETKGDTSTVGVTETWRYRYIDAATGDYKSPAYDVSYDSTYTVIRQAEERWVVDKVEAQPLTGSVK